MSKRKLITDFTLVKVLLDFESDAMRVFKNVPAKYRYTHEKEFFDAVACTIRLAVKSMDTPPTDSTLLRQKYYMLTEAHSELCYAETRLIQLNMDGSVSNVAKAGLDMKLYDVYGNLERLQSSLAKKMSGSDSQGCASAVAPVMIGMPDCNREGGSNA